MYMRSLFVVCLVLLTACIDLPETVTITLVQDDEPQIEPETDVSPPAMAETGSIGTTDPGVTAPYGHYVAPLDVSACAGDQTCIDEAEAHHEVALVALEALDHEYRSSYLVSWGQWAHHDGSLLFSATMSGSNINGPCPPEAECVPARATAVVLGVPSGSNPVAGSATWRGFAYAVDGRQNAIEGKSYLAANLEEASVNVTLAGLGQELFWEALPLVGGSFSDVAGARTIDGAFYGSDHEGAAGQFTAAQGMIGVFGALRQ